MKQAAEVADWTLTWADDPEVNLRVHRYVLVRTCLFFRGATNAAFNASSTDLGKLFPKSCRPLLEKFLDCIYEDPAAMGPLTSHDLGRLYVMADTLQCPSLKNHIVNVFGKLAAARELSSDAFQIMEAAGFTRNMELFKDLLPLVPLEALQASTPYLLDNCGKEFVVAVVTELTRRASQPLPSDSWFFVVEKFGEAYEKGLYCDSAHFLVKGHTVGLRVQPKSPGSDRFMGVAVAAVPVGDAADFEDNIEVRLGVVSWSTGEFLNSVRNYSLTHVTVPHIGDHQIRGWRCDDFFEVSGLTVGNGGFRGVGDDAVKFAIQVGGPLVSS